MSVNNARRSCLLSVVLLFGLSEQAYSLSFTPGHFYATHYDSKSVTEYDINGHSVSTLTLPFLSAGQSLRGLTFGPDNLLYATVADSYNSSVVSFDASGTVMQTYPATGYVSSNVSLGKIAFDSAGYFYVGNSSGLFRFEMGNALSGAQIWNSPYGAFDAEALPNGHLLVADGYYLYELDNQGQSVRSINLSDPNGLVQGTSVMFTDIRGVGYDARNKNIFVSMLGHTGLYFQILKIDGDTGVLKGNQYFNYADDMILTNDGKLIVGSTSQSPGIFDTSLGYQGSFDGASMNFVTQFNPVPLPPALWLFGSGLVALAGCARRKRH